MFTFWLLLYPIWITLLLVVVATHFLAFILFCSIFTFTFTGLIYVHLHFVFYFTFGDSLHFVVCIYVVTFIILLLHYLRLVPHLYHILFPSHTTVPLVYIYIVGLPHTFDHLYIVCLFTLLFAFGTHAFSVVTHSCLHLFWCVTAVYVVYPHDLVTFCCCYVGCSVPVAHVAHTRTFLFDHHFHRSSGY